MVSSDYLIGKVTWAAKIWLFPSKFWLTSCFILVDDRYFEVPPLHATDAILAVTMRVTIGQFNFSTDDPVLLGRSSAIDSSFELYTMFYAV